MSWFEEWFNSPLYEKLYASRNEEEASQLADLIGSIIPKEEFKNILDLGCGRGRHSITLAKRGYIVTGLDLSEKALSTAKQKAASQNINNVRFLSGDMRKPLPQKFDAIVNLFTTFGYFLEDSENVEVLNSVSKMLDSTGVFVIDYLNAEVVRNMLDPFEEGTYNQYSYRITRYIENDMVFKTIRFSGEDLDEPLEYVERVKLYDLEWFKKTLAIHGFEIVELFGNYKGDPFESNRSGRLIIVARKF